MSHSNRKISSSELNLEGTIYGTAPVQAEGTVNGHSFYFRARHDEWTFSVSENSEIDPVDIDNFEAGKKYGFFKQANYGKKGGESASYMDLESAEKIVFDCSLDYSKTINKV